MFLPQNVMPIAYQKNEFVIDFALHFLTYAYQTAIAKEN